MFTVFPPLVAENKAEKQFDHVSFKIDSISRDQK